MIGTRTEIAPQAKTETGIERPGTETGITETETVTETVIVTETGAAGKETGTTETGTSVTTKIGIIETVRTGNMTVTMTVTETVIMAVVNEKMTVTGTMIGEEGDMVVDIVLLIILTIEFLLWVYPKAVPGKTLRTILDKLGKSVLLTSDVTAPERRLVSLSSSTRMI